MPAAATAAPAPARWRGLPTRFSTAPATRTAGSWVAKPRAVAPADCDWPDTSSTSSTGRAKRAARSAAAPVRPGVGPAPSNRPMEASMTSRSGGGAPGSPCRRAASSGGGMAQVSRLTQGEAEARSWKAGSM